MIKTTTDFVTTFVLGFKRNGQWLRKTQLSKGPFIHILRKHSRGGGQKCQIWIALSSKKMLK